MLPEYLLHTWLRAATVLMYATFMAMSTYANDLVKKEIAAAEAGDADAQHMVGWMYETGTGVEADKNTALLWYRKAAKQGHEMAEKDLDRMIGSKVEPKEDVGALNRDESTQNLVPEPNSDLIRKLIGIPSDSDYDSVLSGVEAFSVSVIVAGDISNTLSQYKIQNKFELILRRNGVPIADNGIYHLELRIEGLQQKFGDMASLYAYIVITSVSTNVIDFWSMNPRNVFAEVWSHTVFGIAGESIVENYMLNAVEREAENFANTYLKVNSKSY